MGTPEILSVSPGEGLTIGDLLVEIVGDGFNLPSVEGGHVEVHFGDQEASEVRVFSATRLTCLSPRHALGTVDLTVTNFTPDPPGPPEQSVTLTDAFTYIRPSMATPQDGSNYAEPTLVTKALIEDLRRYVLAESHHDTHPEYADAVSAALAEEKPAPVNGPSLKVTGPTAVEDRFYATNGRISVDNEDGTFAIHDEPLTLQLTYSFVGVGRTSGEVTNLFRALMRYFKLTPDLVFMIGSEEHRLPMEVPFDQRGEFRGQATRQGVYQFSGQVVIRGLNTLTPVMDTGYEVGDQGAEVTSEQGV